MKLTNIALATIIASSFGIANAATVDQGSGVINFTGKVINAPCSIPGDGTINVDLGQVANKVLETGNKFSQSVQYNIQLENCDLGEVKDASDKVIFPAVSKVKVTFTGTPDTTAKELLANTGTSKGVGVRLINADGATMKVGDTSVEMPLADGPNKLAFSARVEANGNKVETGSIISQATYALNYL
ncbi:MULTISPECIES: fimbrial protein [Providencia]|jgi:type 1 fimbria pilin|uniref:fimbrial protein n=1 Tax=Providencia TaxID=586 RepID=UPI001C5A5E0E|nr:MULTISPECIES: fimbrial protein [Providencia]ELR5149941.1 fimbrial protein [Providencia rettgeri]MDR2227204.1 fimbrial protein [Providencia sp.]QXX81464.1 fimbrial protein [Providencia sp. R33]